MAITNAQQARQLYNEGGPMRKIKGQDHMLAYITPNEADKLVKLGGQETMTPEGILAYPPNNYGASVDNSNKSSGNTNQGRDRDFQQRGASKSDYAKTSQSYKDSGTQQVYDGSKNTSQKDSFVPTVPAEAPKAPPKKPKKTKDNYKKSSQFITPTLAAINFVGQGIKNSKLGRYLNTKARENYLENLKEDDPDLYQATVDDLSKLGYATRDVEIYGPKGKRDGPMAPGRDI